MSLSDIGDIVKKLILLSEIDHLPEDDFEKAKDLMRKLKGMGFSNEDIAFLVKPKWSSSSVKAHTKGVEVDNSALYDRIMSIVKELILKGYELDELEMFLKQSKTLESNGSSLSEVSDLLATCKKQNVKVKPLVTFYQDVKSSDLTIPQAITYMSNWAPLEKQGFTVENLSVLSKSSEKIGGFTNVVKAIEEFGSLSAIKTAKKTAQDEADQLEKKLKDLNGKLTELEKQHKALIDKNKAAASGIAKYNKLVSLGVTEQVIKSMTKNLTKFGDVSQTLSAVNSYSDLKAIQNEIKRLKTSKTSLESEIEKLESNIADLKAEVSTIKLSVEQALEPLPEKVSSSVASIDKAAIDSMNKLIEKSGVNLASLEKEYDDFLTRFGELKAAAGRLEEDLNVARVVNSLTRYPSEAKDLSIDYAILLQEAVEKLCLAKCLNPKIPVIIGPYAGQKSEIELKTLFLYVKKGLENPETGAASK